MNLDRPIRLLCLATLLIAAPSAAEEWSAPSRVDVEVVREKIRNARASLSRIAGLEDADRQLLRAQIDDAADRLGRYEKLARRSERYAKNRDGMLLAGVALVGDDVSAVGVADDALLAVVAVGLLGNYLFSRGAVGEPELRQSWMEAIDALRAVGATTRSLMGKLTGKERASDIPSWAKGGEALPGEAPSQTADRILQKKYPDGRYPRGPGSEYNKLKKFFERKK